MEWIPVVRNTYYYSSTVAVDELAEKTINTYPNPTTDQFIFSGVEKEAGLLEIYDITGAKLESRKVMTDEYISVSNYPCGQYLISLRSTKNNYISRIIKID